MPRWSTYAVNSSPATTAHLILPDSDQLATIAAVGTALGVDTHIAASTSVHGITDTSALLTEVGISDLTATGTPSSSTYLRGDNVWAAAAGGGSGDLLAANNLTDVDSAATSLANLGGLSEVGISDLTATGTANSTTFLRGDNTWAEPAGTGAGTHYETITFPSTVAQADNASAWRCPIAGTLDSAIIWCDTAPATATIIVDLKLNGTTVFTGGTERPVIAISGTDDVSGPPTLTTLAAGDLLQFSVTQLNASDEGNIGQLLCMIVWSE